MLPMTPPTFFAGEVFSFLATVDVLLSLNSLMSLNLRVVAAAADALVAPVADVVTGFLPLVEPIAELKVVALSFLLGDRAFSAQLPKRLDTLLCFAGDFEGPGVLSVA